MSERHEIARSGAGATLPNETSQRGAVMVFVIVGMLALIAMAGLALDTGYLLLNKGRIQNAVDAAALAAAKQLDESHDTVVSEIAARQIFADNAAAAGNQELKRAYDSGNGDISVSVQFSSSLNPFVAGSYQAGVTPDGYVRVRAMNFNWPSWFVAMVGVNQLETDATAVAGPSPTFTKEDEVCDLAPMMVCGTPQDDAPEDTYLGYTINEVQVLKADDSQGGWDGGIGSGNFQLVRLEGAHGGADIRHAMAGDGIGCVSSSAGIDTEPGNTIGPVRQGLNTRFGEWTGPLHGTSDEFPPDIIVTDNGSEITKDWDTGTVTVTDAQGNACDGTNSPHNDCLSFTWSDYLARVGPGAFDFPPPEAGPASITGARWRRVMKLPIGNCDGTANGQGTVDYLGTGCFFLLQRVSGPGQGNGGGNNPKAAGGGGNGGPPDCDDCIFGQFVEGCDVGGEAGPTPNNGPGGYRIVLYEDPDSGDS